MPPPERDEDPDAGNMGTNLEQAGSSEPLVVPLVQDENTFEIPLDPSTLVPPASSIPTGTTTTPPAPPTKPLSKKPSSPGKPLVAPGPGKMTKKVASRKSTQIKPSQLSGALQASMAAASGSKALTLYTSKAAASVNDKLVLHISRIMERTWSEDSLGSLEQYADTWNDADLTDVTSGLGKDAQPTIDPRGCLPIIKQFGRLKRCMRDTDTAWYDVERNVMVSIYSELTFLHN
jgi:hypothetical protein